MNDKKVNKKWKTIAIIFIILFSLLLIGEIITRIQIEKKIKETNICYYDICEDYPQAEYDYDTKLCDCYNYDLLGYPTLNKTVYTGKR